MAHRVDTVGHAHPTKEDDYDRPSSFPVLSPSLSAVAPNRSSMASQRLLSGVSALYRTYRPDLTDPPPVPTSSTGRSWWAWRFGSAMALPKATMQLSRSVPSPSFTAFNLPVR